MSLGITKGGTTKCGSTKCKCCEAVPQTPVPKVIINDHAISLPSGNCKSKNIIYLAQCNLCPDKFYVGSICSLKVHYSGDFLIIGNQS